MRKRKQHYVWRRYLKSWAMDEKIFCLSDGKIFRTNLENVAQERYFYKLRELSKEDVAFIRSLLIEGSHPILADINEGWLGIFNIIFRYNNIN